MAERVKVLVTQTCSAEFSCRNPCKAESRQLSSVVGTPVRKTVENRLDRVILWPPCIHHGTFALPPTSRMCACAHAHTQNSSNNKCNLKIGLHDYCPQTPMWNAKYLDPKAWRIAHLAKYLACKHAVLKTHVKMQGTEAYIFNSSSGERGTRSTKNSLGLTC